MSDGPRREATAKIINKRGMHARASAKLVEAAARFKSEITVTKDGQTVDARSIMGLMMLAASLGSEVQIVAQGPDADEAMVAILALVEASPRDASSEPPGESTQSNRSFPSPRTKSGYTSTRPALPSPHKFILHSLRWLERLKRVQAARGCFQCVNISAACAKTCAICLIRTLFPL